MSLTPQDIDVIPAHENFFAINTAGQKLWGAAEGAFAGIIGDILITQAAPGRISRVRWDGAAFAVNELAEAAELKQVAFSPFGVGAVPAVKQVYERLPSFVRPRSSTTGASRAPCGNSRARPRFSTGLTPSRLTSSCRARRT